jgi:uncharacterized repeat protein (TIGR02543 family)
MRGGFSNRDVSYVLNGGDGSAPAASTVVEGTTITLASAPSRDGYLFAGWRVGANSYSPNSSFVVTTAVVFTASWIFIDLGGGTYS